VRSYASNGTGLTASASPGRLCASGRSAVRMRPTTSSTAPPRNARSISSGSSRSTFDTETSTRPSLALAEAEASGISRPSTARAGPATVAGSEAASWCPRFISNTWYVGVRTISPPSGSVSSIACSTFTVCAMLAIRSRSAKEWKTSKCSAATMASRMVFCWNRKPGFVPSSTSHQVPHSSSTMPNRFSGSCTSITAACARSSGSIPWAATMVLQYASASKSVALPFAVQLPPIV
jgi:hypothetical protein